MIDQNLSPKIPLAKRNIFPGTSESVTSDSFDRSVLDKLLDSMWRYIVKRFRYVPIGRWTNRSNFRRIRQAYFYGNAKVRLLIVKGLGELDHEQSREILVHALNDNVLPVVNEAIRSLHLIGIKTNSTKEKIEKIVRQWEEELEAVKIRWQQADYTAHDGPYLDKSKMVRLKEAKSLLKKFKSSMAIG